MPDDIPLLCPFVEVPYAREPLPSWLTRSLHQFFWPILSIGGQLLTKVAIEFSALKPGRRADNFGPIVRPAALARTEGARETIGGAWERFYLCG